MRRLRARRAGSTPDAPFAHLLNDPIGHAREALQYEPNPGPQSFFLALDCFEALYGGQAGGGKSDALLVDAARYISVGYGGAYSALLLRRTFPDLEKSLIRRSHELYPRLGGQYNEQKKTWVFPLGERIYFGHAEHERDVHSYQGAEFQYIGFDELTHFTRYQYTYLFSRLRSSRGVPLRLRAGTNPGGEGHEWVFTRFGAWLDPDAGSRAEPNEIREIVFIDGEETVVEPGEAVALRVAWDAATPAERAARNMLLPHGRTFVPARLSDNPYLASDGNYERALDELDPVTRAQLKSGDWLKKPAAGEYFKRGWWKWLDATPADVVSRARYWDLAASLTGDYAVGARVARMRSGLWVVEDVVRRRGTPGDVRALVRATAELDGRGVPLWLEQDPGQAGVDQIASYVADLAGWTVRGRRKTVDKVTAAGPLSAQAQAGNVALVRGPWNAIFVEEYEEFPDGKYDDQVDAGSGAFAVQVQPPQAPAQASDLGDDY